MKYVIYLRVSTKEGQDLRTQEHKCLKFLRDRDSSNFKYVVFSDKISSRKPLEEREGIQSALKAIDKGDILVGQKVDRLARNSYECHFIKHILDMKKADLILVDQPGIENKVIFGVYVGIAEEEVKAIRLRIKDKLSAKKDRGERVSRWLPYGYSGVDENNLVLVKGKDKEYSLKPGLLLADSFEQEALSKMCLWFDSNLSYREIVGLLNESGYKNRKGNPFHLASVYRILARTGRKRPKNQVQNDSTSLLTHSV